MKRTLLYLLLFTFFSASAEDKIALPTQAQDRGNHSQKLAKAISEKLPSTTFLSHEGFAGSLLPTGSNDGPGLFRIKSQKLVTFDVRRTYVLSSGLLNAISTARERPSVWMYIFYQAILFPEHYFW